MVWLPSVPRVERARPASDEFLAFWRFGPDKGPSRRVGGDGGWRSGGLSGGKGGRGRY
jgi:hypothetical protein